MLRRVLLCVVATVCFGVSATSGFGGENALVLFTGRSNATEKAVLKDFEDKTGIAVTVVDGKPDELIEQIANGAEADLFMTVDGGILDAAKQRDIFATTDSPAIRESAPAELRDKDNAWVGVTTRARVIVYAKDRVKPEELSSYAALAEPKWKGKVLVRSAGALYNVSLLASLIEVYGEAAAEKWAEGLAANLAREPKGGDRDQAKAVAAGEGDVAIMNSYYIGQMLKSDKPEEVAAAEAIGVFFPDQDLGGTHINISGIGVVRGSKNAEAAIKLVEYLLTVPAQEKLSAGNNEFPVNPQAKKSPLLESWGDFKTQKIDFAILNENKKLAASIFNEAGWK